VGGLTVAWLVAAALAADPPAGLSRYEFDGTEMAIPIKIVLYAADEPSANRAARDALARIHQLNGVLSDYDSASELVQLSGTAGSGRRVAVSADLWTVLWQGQEIARQSDGAFDATVGPVVRLWRRARRLHEMPSPERIRDALALVGHEKLRLDPKDHSAQLAAARMRLDLGGIAKGYAMDEALAVLTRQGITRAMVHAGGDIRLGDPPPDRPGWKIGAAPSAPGAPPRFTLSLANCAVGISGDTWQFVELGGQRYSHIVDPKTGVGLTDHSLVTVVAPRGLTSDPLSTAVSVLGPEKGLKLIEATPGAAALIVLTVDGKPRLYESARWKELPRAER
jgi:FAD:protein FMN transferase